MTLTEAAAYIYERTGRKIDPANLRQRIARGTLDSKRVGHLHTVTLPALKKAGLIKENQE